GGEELAALDQMIDQGGNMVPIGSRAQEGRCLGRAEILPRHGEARTFDLDLALMWRQIDWPLQADALGNVAIEALDRGHADFREHGAPIALGERQIAHQCSPSTNFLYPASSISPSSSLALASRNFMNQPFPIGSELMVAGSSTSA